MIIWKQKKIKSPQVRLPMKIFITKPNMGINIDTSKEGKRSEAGVNMIFKEAIKGYTMYKLDNKHRILVYINH